LHLFLGDDLRQSHEAEEYRMNHNYTAHAYHPAQHRYDLEKVHLQLNYGLRLRQSGIGAGAAGPTSLCLQLVVTFILRRHVALPIFESSARKMKDQLGQVQDCWIPVGHVPACATLMTARMSAIGA
jgi:hypothetical protein